MTYELNSFLDKDYYDSSFIHLNIMDIQNKIMIGALIFLGLSGLYYIWLWLTGFIQESRSEGEIKQPWE